MAPIDAEAVRADVLALAGLDPAELSRLLEPDAAIRNLAARVTAGKSTPEARALAIVDALRKRWRAQAFVEWPRVEPVRARR